MLKNRINIIFKETGLKQREFAATLGVTESYISRLINGTHNKISETLALLIQEKYGYSAEWVLTGKGDKFINSKNSFVKQKTIALVKALNDEEIKAVMGFVKNIDEIKNIFNDMFGEITCVSETIEEISPVYEIKKYTVPIFGRVAGGQPILAIEEKDKTIETSIPCDCALELAGDSMEPDFKDGDILLVKRQPILENGELGIIMKMDGAEIAEVTFKKFYANNNGTVILKPLNINYKDMELYSSDIVIFGKVVGKA